MFQGVKTGFVLKEENPKGKLDQWLFPVTGEKDNKRITDPGLDTQSRVGNAEDPSCGGGVARFLITPKSQVA